MAGGGQMIAGGRAGGAEWGGACGSGHGGPCRHPSPRGVPRRGRVDRGRGFGGHGSHGNGGQGEDEAGDHLHGCGGRGRRSVEAGGAQTNAGTGVNNPDHAALNKTKEAESSKDVATGKKQHELRCCDIYEAEHLISKCPIYLGPKPDAFFCDLQETLVSSKSLMMAQQQRTQGRR